MRVLREVTDVALSDGAVTKVHPSGAIDVAYDVDGSVGLSLTKEKDIFQVVGEDRKVKEKPVVVKKVKVRVYLNRIELQGRCSVCLHECFLRNVCLSALIQHAILGVCCTLMQV